MIKNINKLFDTKVSIINKYKFQDKDYIYILKDYFINDETVPIDLILKFRNIFETEIKPILIHQSDYMIKYNQQLELLDFIIDNYNKITKNYKINLLNNINNSSEFNIEIKDNIIQIKKINIIRTIDEINIIKLEKLFEKLSNIKFDYNNILLPCFYYKSIISNIGEIDNDYVIGDLSGICPMFLTLDFIKLGVNLGNDLNQNRIIQPLNLVFDIKTDFKILNIIRQFANELDKSNRNINQIINTLPISKIYASILGI